MRYPSWFPYPKAWLKGFILLTITPFFLVLLSLFTSVTFNLMSITLDANNIVASANNNFISWLFVIVVGIIFPMFVWGHIDQLFWGKEKRFSKWIPSASSWLEGLWSWIIAVLALSIILLIAVIKVQTACPNYEYLRYCTGMRNEKDARNFFTLLGIIFLVFSAYLYHFQLLLRKWWLTNSPKWFPKKKINQKVKLKATEQPTVKPKTIEDEMEILKAQIEKDKKNNS